MIKPSEMRKFSAVVLEAEKDAVLRELKERGIIHLVKVDGGEDSEFGLAPGNTEGINVKAGEYLSKIDSILDVFELARNEDEPALKKRTSEPALPVPVEELAPLELFKHVDEKLSGFEERVSKISSRLEQLKKENEEILAAQDVMSKLRLLNLGPEDLQGFESSFTVTGIIPTEEVPMLQGDVSEVTDLVYVHSAKMDKSNSILLVVAHGEFESEIRRALHMHRVEEFHVPESFFTFNLDDAINKIDMELSRIQEEEGTLISEIREIKDAETQGLLTVRESLQIEKMLDETNTFFGNTDSTFLLNGWVPATRVDEILGVIEEASDGRCVTRVEEKTGKEHPPTLLENSRIAKPMEMLAVTYGTPSYGMMDPSIFMVISFPIIFGLMFGDVGQGLVLAIVGYLLGFHFRVDASLKKLGRILLYCGIAAIGGGFLYGEVFGLEGIVPALWLHPLHSIMTLLTFSFYLGMAHISLGCLVRISDEISHGNTLHAIVSPWGVTGLWFLWGGVMLIKSNGIDGALWLIFGLFSPGTAVASLTVVGPAILLPIFIIAAGAKLVEGLGIAWSIYEAYEAVNRYVFNMISYVRVGALAIIHAVFANLMNTGLDGVSGLPAPISTVLWILILVGGNLFIIALEALISFIHTLRLHYYEWFSKFYEGGGTTFKPFMAVRKYTVPSKI